MSDVAGRHNGTFSVVIPAYNAGPFIDEALASVYAQTLAPGQVIVINDGSTDDTEQRLRRLASRFPPTFLWQSQPNRGMTRARNAALRLATRKYVAFLDADDIWHPNKLECQLEHFASDPDLVLSFTGYRYRCESGSPPADRPDYPESVIDRQGWDADSGALLGQLLTGTWPIGPTSGIAIRRDALEDVSLFDETTTVACDLALCLELLIRRMKVDYLPEVLVEYRWHGSNASGDVARMWEDVVNIYDRFWERHGAELSGDVRARAHAGRAHWHLLIAIDSIRHGNKTRARRHILKAARIRPSAIRPGWVRMLGIGPPPAGPWLD
jgi:cellulose synthase/poly-beta-1,6-N-acetylglucosamine synthase-like glycosyltransferase